MAEYQSLMDRAETNRDAFETADLQCEIWDQVDALLKTILTGAAGRAGEVAKALYYLRDLVEKAQQGDLASVFYPEPVQAFLEHYNTAKQVWSDLTSDDLTRMQTRLDGCLGKVTADTHLRAEAFLADLAAAKGVWDSQVAPGLNDLRSKGLECAGLEHAAWRACIADAECRGVPPDCGPEPSLEGP